MPELIFIIIIAFLIDLSIGDPNYKYHPVRLIGWWIGVLENCLRTIGWDKKLGGIFLTLSTGIIVPGIYFILTAIFYSFHPIISFFFNLYLCYSCLALGDLLSHMKPIIRSLEKGDINNARIEAAKVVGREVNNLESDAIGRAAIETMAENFVDGFLSPLFWYFTGAFISLLSNQTPIRFALGFMLLFKVASTLDSMVGYRNERYILFGWASARLDDFMNYIPARLSLFFLFLGAIVVRLHPIQGLRISLRDRLKHDSPNAGHPESFIAGALNIRLGGPLQYPEGLKNKPWLGDGTASVRTPDIHKAVALIRYCGCISILSILSLFLFIYHAIPLSFIIK